MQLPKVTQQTLQVEVCSAWKSYRNKAGGKNHELKQTTNTKSKPEGDLVIESAAGIPCSQVRSQLGGLSVCQT